MMAEILSAEKVGKWLSAAQHEAFLDLPSTPFYISAGQLVTICESHEALRAALDDYQESQRKVVNDEMHGDEQHCTCVPYLRREIEALRAALPDPKKLRFLAKYIRFAEESGVNGDAVQRDLRAWADKAEAALQEPE